VTARVAARLFWLLVSMLGAGCLVSLTGHTGNWRYLVGLPAFVFTMARSLD